MLDPDLPPLGPRVTIGTHVSGSLLRLEAFSVPDATSLDCFVVDADQPGVDLGCDPWQLRSW
jgi:hypothetical protein